VVFVALNEVKSSTIAIILVSMSQYRAFDFEQKPVSFFNYHLNIFKNCIVPLTRFPAESRTKTSTRI
jgi:hypothetical protein